MLTRETKSQEEQPQFLDKVYYYHNDHLGTPQKLTNDAGEVVWFTDYAPFGYAFGTGEVGVTNKFRFPGQYDDGYLYYNHHRYYDPETGRYSQVDPIYSLTILRFDQNNGYIYVQNSPIGKVDPFGLSTCSDSEIQKDLQSIDSLYWNFIANKRKGNFYSSFYQVINYYRGKPSQVCVDLAGEFANIVNSKNYKCCFAEDHFYYIYMWGYFNTVDEIYCNGCDAKKRYARYDPFARLIKGW